MTQVIDNGTGEVTGSPSIYQRINAVQKAVREVRKVRQNEHYKYKFIGHDDVTEALRDEKVKQGIVTIVSVTGSERIGPLLRLTVELSYINVDCPGDSFVVDAVGESYSTDKNEKPNDLQAGKALSYAVKLAELKLFQLVGDSTPDSEASHAESAAGAPAPKEVTRADLDALLALCADVNTDADLQLVNREINLIAKFMTREQMLELSVEHGKAKGRITQPQQGAQK